ncbi:hypothetical protein T484DRAFT_1889791 [Baffinella frigidus]|nr:hypothetical protein T484DRAFT_1889791 [Cryptophyta sp. CCMP2293]
MPISVELGPRNFRLQNRPIPQATVGFEGFAGPGFQGVVDVPNSMSVLTDLLPLALAMSKKQLTGIYNFTNPGVISHNQVLQMYKEEVDPKFAWDNFSVEEQGKILAAGRSNKFLDTSKILAAGRSNNFLDTTKLEAVGKILAAGRSNNFLDTAKKTGQRLPDILTATREAAKETGQRLPDILTATREALCAARKRLEDAGAYPSGLPQKMGPGNTPQ